MIFMSCCSPQTNFACVCCSSLTNTVCVNSLLTNAVWTATIDWYCYKQLIHAILSLRTVAVRIPILCGLQQ